MITTLQPDQLESFIGNVVRSFESTDLLSQVRVDKIAKSWGDFIRSGTGFCYAATWEAVPMGFLLALHTDDLISGEKHALEYLWLCKREGRKLGLGFGLFRAFEDGAKAAGCYRIVCGCNQVFKLAELARFYRMKGYKIFAEAYHKVIGN